LNGPAYELGLHRRALFNLDLDAQMPHHQSVTSLLREIYPPLREFPAASSNELAVEASRWQNGSRLHATRCAFVAA
jgi:hypothetical protein